MVGWEEGAEVGGDGRKGDGRTLTSAREEVERACVHVQRATFERFVLRGEFYI